jgi:4-hydroxy-tetrahydrodipicolinate reductase
VHALAKKAKVAVLATGVNPGFVMDALPIALTAVCQRVDRVTVHRIQDARHRRLPFQQKIGAGLTTEQFQKRGRGAASSTSDSRVDRDDCRLAQLDARPHHRSRGPKLAQVTVSSEFLAVDPATCAGSFKEGIGYRKKEPANPASHGGLSRRAGSVRPDRDRRQPAPVRRIAGGVHGDVATAARS